MSDPDHSNSWTLPEALAWGQGQDPPDSWQDFLRTLHALCRSGRVSALGRLTGQPHDTLVPISASDWADLYFDSDGKQLRSADLLCGILHRRRAWTSVRFPQADLVREWPKAGAASFVTEQASRYWGNRLRERGQRGIRGQRRRDFINRFAAKQQRIRCWISFVEIADACARTASATSIAQEDEARSLAYRRLVESMARGEFEKNGKSWVLLLYPDLHASIPPHRLAREYLHAMIDAYGLTDFSSASGLVREQLWFCWLPSELCREWFERHLLTWPDEFNPRDQALDARPSIHEQNPRPEISEPTPDAVAPQKGRRGRSPGSGSFDDAEALAEMLRLLASNKVKSVHAAARNVVAEDLARSTSSEKSTVSRLRGKFATQFGTRPPPGKTWSDVAVELQSNCSRIDASNSCNINAI
jgi:hypothetical protein